MGGIKRFLKGGREPEPLRYITIDTHVVTISLARRLWVMRTKDVGWYYAFSSKGGTLVDPLGYATMYGSEQDALSALGRMTVDMASQMEAVSMYQVLCERMGIDPVETGEAADDWSGLGLIDPGAV